MKKLILVLACVSFAASSFGQLKVTSSGQVRIGTTSSFSSSSSSSTAVRPGGTASSNPDTIASLYVAGPEQLQSGGRIAFGERGDVSIGESVYAPNTMNTKGMLLLSGKGGFLMSCDNKNIMGYDASMNTSDGTPLITYVPVRAPQYLTTSDERSKTDIEPLENVGTLLKELVPVSYVLVDENGAGTQENTPMRSNALQSANHQYGFLAQEVREIFPDLVYEDSEGLLCIDYTGFIPVLVDAVKSLQDKVEEQEQTIARLTGAQPQENQQESNPVVASLSQNRPNPFRTSTVINCVIPEITGSAFICVYDLNGNQKLRRDISDRGETSVTIEGNTLTAGMYIYALIADGVEIDSKRMILTD